MKTAKFIKDVSEHFRGSANLYELSEAINYDGLVSSKKKTKFVVCSTVNAPFSGYETYIFPADKKGGVLSWLELEGSMRGTTTDTEVLKNAGYELIKMK